jgi:hypothetical protein
MPLDADTRSQEEADMTAPSTGFTIFVSDHRFRLTLATCILALILMMTAIYATVGFGPPWGTLRH